MSLDLAGIIRCPTCKGLLEEVSSTLICAHCDVSYTQLDGMWDLLPSGVSDLKLSERSHYTERTDFYLHMHATWCGSPFYRHYHACFLDELRILPHGSLILETGCGLGHDGLELLRSGYRVVETDIAPGQLAQARILHGESGFSGSSSHLLADAEHLPFASGSFDGAFMVASLHHLPHPLEALREARRVLREGGILVLGTEPNNWQNYTIYPLGKLLLKVARSFMRDSVYGEEMVSEADQLTEGFSRRQLESLLRQAGFTCIECKPAGYLSAAIFFFSTETSHLSGRDMRLFPLEKAAIPLDELLGRLPLLSSYPWHWNAVAG
jgi:ubiquinone/menaquinone biosynthesis C-methylase UbiE